MALSLNITVGYAGQVNMGHAAFVAIGGYVYAMMTSYVAGWNCWIAMLFGGIATAVAGLLVGIPTLRLNDVYFVKMCIRDSDVRGHGHARVHNRSHSAPHARLRDSVSLCPYQP